MSSLWLRLAQRPVFVYWLSFVSLDVLTVLLTTAVVTFVFYSHLLLVANLGFLVFYIAKAQLLLQARCVKYLSQLLVPRHRKAALDAICRGRKEIQVAISLLVRRFLPIFQFFFSGGVDVSRLLCQLSVFSSDDQVRRFFAAVHRWLNMKVVKWDLLGEDESPDDLAERVRSGAVEISFVCSRYDIMLGMTSGRIYSHLTQLAHDVADVAIADWAIVRPSWRAHILLFWQTLDSYCQTYWSLLSNLGSDRDPIRGFIQEVIDRPVIETIAARIGTVPESLLTRIMANTAPDTTKLMKLLLTATPRESLSRSVPEVVNAIDAILTSEGRGPELAQEFMAPVTSLVGAVDSFLKLPDNQKGLKGLTACVENGMGDTSFPHRVLTKVMLTAEAIATQQDLTFLQLTEAAALPLTLFAVPLVTVLQCRTQTIPKMIDETWGIPMIRPIAKCLSILAKDIAAGQRITRQRLAISLARFGR
jgi:hypothetical protein